MKFAEDYTKMFLLQQAKAKWTTGTMLFVCVKCNNFQVDNHESLLSNYKAK